MTVRVGPVNTGGRAVPADPVSPCTQLIGRLPEAVPEASTASEGVEAAEDIWWRTPQTDMVLLAAAARAVARADPAAARRPHRRGCRNGSPGVCRTCA